MQNGYANAALSTQAGLAGIQRQQLAADGDSSEIDRELQRIASANVSLHSRLDLLINRLAKFCLVQPECAEKASPVEACGSEFGGALQNQAFHTLAAVSTLDRLLTQLRV
jgi:hypothetical protein